MNKFLQMIPEDAVIIAALICIPLFLILLPVIFLVASVLWAGETAVKYVRKGTTKI